MTICLVICISYLFYLSKYLFYGKFLGKWHRSWSRFIKKASDQKRDKSTEFNIFQCASGSMILFENRSSHRVGCQIISPTRGWSRIGLLGYTYHGFANFCSFSIIVAKNGSKCARKATMWCLFFFLLRAQRQNDRNKTAKIDHPFLNNWVVLNTPSLPLLEVLLELKY